MQAARDQFWLHGFNGTSLDDLTVVTGLGRGSLYAAFNDKRALFLRALGGCATTVMSQLLAVYAIRRKAAATGSLITSG